MPSSRLAFALERLGHANETVIQQIYTVNRE